MEALVVGVPRRAESARGFPRARRALAGLALLLLTWSAAALGAAPLAPAEIARLRAVDRQLTLHIAALEAETRPGTSFLAYQKAYHAAVPQKLGPLLTPAAALAELAAAPLVLLGDNHATPQAQANTVLVLEAMAGRPDAPTLVLEWIDRSFQKTVDRYLAGQLTLEALARQIEFDKLWGFSWTSYKKILLTAKRLKVRILLVERLRARHSLAERDRFITACLATDRKAQPTRRYLVVYGEYHLAGRGHLGDLLAAAGFPPPLVAIGDAETAWWQALGQLRDPAKISFARLGPRLLFAGHGSPLEQKVAHRRYLMKLLAWSRDDFEDWVDDSEARPRTGTKSVAERFEELHAGGGGGGGGGTR